MLTSLYLYRESKFSTLDGTKKFVLFFFYYYSVRITALDQTKDPSNPPCYPQKMLHPSS